MPRVKSQKLKAESWKPRAASQEPQAKSRKPRATSQEPQGKSQEPGAKGQKLKDKRLEMRNNEAPGDSVLAVPPFSFELSAFSF
jgi:hypothetical protein